MTNDAHVVMVMADDSDYPSRVFESLIEAKAYAMGKQERSGTRVYVTSVPLVRAAHDGEMADPTAITSADLKTLVMQEDDERTMESMLDRLGRA